MAAGPATAAARRAAANFAANLAALADTQPRLVEAVGSALPAMDFIFGRDGYLTAFDAQGLWWSGCSLPKRANAAMLRSLKGSGPASCLLAPPHAASVRVSLEMTGSASAVHAILTAEPDLQGLSILLACDDFSAEVRSHRLWFAWGAEWVRELEKLFEEQPGLPTPSQFIRVPATQQTTIESMIGPAQAVFTAALARRSARAREIRDAWRPGGDQSAGALCVITTRQFSLWGDAAFTLGAALRIGPPRTGAAMTVADRAPSPAQGDGHSRQFHFQSSTGGGKESIVPAVIHAPILRSIYLDEPLHGSPLAMLSAAVDCDAVVTADVARADMTELLPRDLPWITWMTTPRVPAFAAAGPNDALLVADPSWKRNAVEAGWPGGRVEVARWPDLVAIWTGDAAGASDALAAIVVEPAAPALAIIADTCPLDPPERLEDFSSQRLLWNSIRMELEADPLMLAGVDPDAYLDERLKQFGVSGEGLDRGLFINGLIVPCYGQGIARLLMGAGAPVRLFGRGWEDLPDFAPDADGPILSRPALARAVAASAALVHVWPMAHAHPIDAAGRTVVRPMHRRTAILIRDAMLALTSSKHPGASMSVKNANDRLDLQRVLRRIAGRTHGK
jgi:hypothetical protein